MPSAIYYAVPKKMKMIVALELSTGKLCPGMNNNCGKFQPCELISSVPARALKFRNFCKKYTNSLATYRPPYDNRMIQKNSPHDGGCMWRSSLTHPNLVD